MKFAIRLTPFFKDTTMGLMIPKEMKYNLHHGNVSNVRDLRDFFETCNKLIKVIETFFFFFFFFWDHYLVPLGLSASAPGLSTFIKSWKYCIKSDFKEIFFNHPTNVQSDKIFSLISKFRSQRAVSFCPGAIYMYKSWQECIKSDLKEIF